VKLLRTRSGVVVEQDGRRGRLPLEAWDGLFREADPLGRLAAELLSLEPAEAAADLLAPIGSQEVWAAGVTYFRSRDARMEEAREAGGGDFYDRVYSAARPELFFKASPHRVVGHGQKIRIRADARWSVPEPELTLAINAAGRIFGYTIGDDVSSRDIEGENPLYLPQAKVYDGGCALGPGLLLARDPLPPDTAIRLLILRAGEPAFEDETSLASLKRRPEELAEYLFRETSFPNGCFLLTGTGIVPPAEFGLLPGDRVRITIPPLGTLENEVA
jgi:2-dehydro-3-deoxy-D-arabinonate dehydratase